MRPTEYLVRLHIAFTQTKSAHDSYLALQKVLVSRGWTLTESEFLAYWNS